ncbi:PilZ domain-containing protein [Halioxenophilus sp. WMMB6]|uniref:PilZ domain-containing protein n=1 Tax=Halioxenophilus sp. WMMB6 TaxID=3073815 RepID=UPI00295E2586|nr:PilZ domain-containing protein [Halioxenophilus sp. WMMB6]
MEKRQCQRTQYHCRLMINHPELGEQQGVCQDISDSGLFVCLDCDTRLPVGSTLALQVVTGLPHGPQRMTRVVRSDAAGLGLQFIA